MPDVCLWCKCPISASGDLSVKLPSPMQDLAVQREGTFVLRYRVFDIWATVAGPDQHPILAECYGGTFRVYSTRDFPGLQASTELTKVSCDIICAPCSPVL